MIYYVITAFLHKTEYKTRGFLNGLPSTIKVEFNFMHPYIPIIIEELSDIDRLNEPVTLGLPLPQSYAHDPSCFFLKDPQNNPISLQSSVLSRWPDHSIKWLLLDFQATLAAKTKKIYELHNTSNNHHNKLQGIHISQKDGTWIINTEAACFFINQNIYKPFDQVVVNGIGKLNPTQSNTFLLNQGNTRLEPHIDSIHLEQEGPIRVTLFCKGLFKTPEGKPEAVFTSRIHFFLKSTIAKIEFTLHNPKPAKHRGGLWDLGDKNSYYFKKLSTTFGSKTESHPTIKWKCRSLDPFSTSSAQDFLIYQDSSGGKNWNSPNHVNRFGKVMHQFCGYRIIEDQHMIQEGKRAVPIIRSSGIEGTIQDFWQNFPKALEVHKNQFAIHLFPNQYQDYYELQPGEQKTHTIFVNFTHESSNDLSWVHSPLVAHSSPEWYSSTKAIGYLSPTNPSIEKDSQAMIQLAIEGNMTFSHKREVIDEYGWRHFGDLYADHENAYYNGSYPVISHYNNQFDCAYAMLIQFLRSGNPRWHLLTNELVKHVIDIDIYHTKEDKSAYAGGLFWHTDHYSSASTSTHRTFSKESLKHKPAKFCGGGPANEHNYTTGLLHYYYLTGSEQAKESVLQLANWVINMDNPKLSFLGTFNQLPTGKASMTAGPNYHGPGRGSANSINALLDGFRLIGNKKYLSKAEELLHRSIHPKDNIQTLDLLNAEQRWSYTVFLEILGKYLDFKLENQNIDDMFYYAKKSLLHYSRWMYEYEVPFLTHKDRLQYPTETWAAQDIRKNCIFLYAAKYSDHEEERKRFLKKADFFYQESIAQLKSFKTHAYVRPLIIIMPRTMMHTYYQKHPIEVRSFPDHQHDFGTPQRFISQRQRMKEEMTSLPGLIRTCARLFTLKWLKYFWIHKRIKF